MISPPFPSRIGYVVILLTPVDLQKTLGFLGISWDPLGKWSSVSTGQRHRVKLQEVGCQQLRNPQGFWAVQTWRFTVEPLLHKKHEKDDDDKQYAIVWNIIIFKDEFKCVALCKRTYNNYCVYNNNTIYIYIIWIWGWAFHGSVGIGSPRVGLTSFETRSVFRSVLPEKTDADSARMAVGNIRKWPRSSIYYLYAPTYKTGPFLG